MILREEPRTGVLDRLDVRYIFVYCDCYPVAITHEHSQ